MSDIKFNNLETNRLILRKFKESVGMVKTHPQMKC